MDEKDFPNPSGSFVKNKLGQLTFMPDRALRGFSVPSELVSLIVEAHSNLSLLSGRGLNLPNPHLLIKPALRNEAIESSKIEGTMADLSDVLLVEAEGKALEEGDPKQVRQVLNYIKALEDCLGEMEKGKKISKIMLLEAHRTLLHKVRGHNLRVGEFRKEQNWLNAPVIELTPYVPPPPEHVPKVVDDLMDFINNPPKDMPVIVQAAIIHYQFEAIHPFVDGNGRIGRLLLTLYFCEKNALSQPLLYLSEYFEKNRKEYMYRLLRVSQYSEWLEWIEFFLKAVNTQAKYSLEKINKMESLNKKYHMALKDSSRKTHDVVDYLFANPVTSIPKLADAMGVTYVTAKSIVKELEEKSIISEMTNQKRNKLYMAKNIIDTLQKP
jgi:Fic family protein